MLKRLFKSIFPESVVNKVVRFKNNHLDGYALKSYSQEGEDMILRRLFEKQIKGFYVDVGALHPKRFSNTFFFYKKGWNGINIDAMPNSMKAFNKMRKRDINIEKPIADKKQVLTYYSFNEPALNGFVKDLSDERDVSGEYFIKSTTNMETATLNEVLDVNLSKNQEIDFLSIDVEGLDFMVLKSLDFNKYKPKVILIEILGNNMKEIDENEIAKYLKQYDYTIYSKTINTVFFVGRDFMLTDKRK